MIAAVDAGFVGQFFIVSLGKPIVEVCSKLEWVVFVRLGVEMTIIVHDDGIGADSYAGFQRASCGRCWERGSFLKGGRVTPIIYISEYSGGVFAELSPQN